MTGPKRRAITLASALLGASIAAGAAEIGDAASEGSAPTAAPEIRTIRLETNTNCPSAPELEAELSPLLTSFRVDAAASETARVTESDGVVTVTARDKSKTFDDASLPCRERARLAAVFVALTLEPPDLGADPEPSPPPPPPPKPVEPPRAPRAEPKPAPTPLVLELGPTVRGGFGASLERPALTGGVEARLRFGASFGPYVGLGYGAPSTLALATADVRVESLPLEAGLGLALFEAPTLFQGTKGWAELGVAAPIFWARSDDFRDARESVRLDVGARAGLVLRAALDERWGTFLGLDVTYFPKPYDFVVTPDGRVGATPDFWIGARLGVALDLAALR